MVPEVWEGWGSWILNMRIRQNPPPKNKLRWYPQTEPSIPAEPSRTHQNAHRLRGIPAGEKPHHLDHRPTPEAFFFGCPAFLVLGLGWVFRSVERQNFHVNLICCSPRCHIRAKVLEQKLQRSLPLPWQTWRIEACHSARLGEWPRRPGLAVGMDQPSQERYGTTDTDADRLPKCIRLERRRR